MRKAGRARRLGLLLLVGGTLPLTGRSAQVLEASVIREQDRFILHSETRVQAPVPEVRARLTDYANLPQINPALKRVDLLERLKDGGVRLGVVSEFCLLAICLNFNWVQDVQGLPNGDIAVTLVPDRGDFRQGSGRWRLLPDTSGTRLIFDVDLTPKLWLPGVFGSWVMKRKLFEEALETGQALERRAQALERTAAINEPHSEGGRIR